MKKAQKEVLIAGAKSVVQYIDNLPTGKFIPSLWSAPNGFINEKILVEDVPVEHLIPNEKKTDNVILQIHGGGYLVALCDPYRDIAIQYSNIAGNAEVFSIDYRVAPTNQYPSALEDAVTVYKWLLKEGYDNNKIIMTGDSAGGNLVLSTALYLRDHNIPLPKIIIAISPWTNVANDFPSIKFNEKKDIILGENGLIMRNQIYDPIYFQGANIKNPYVSPVNGDYKEIGNLLIQVGGHEILLDDALKVAQKARETGCNVKITVYDEMPHDFQVLIPQLEQSQKAWNEIKNFIEENI